MTNHSVNSIVHTVLTATSQ